MNVIEQLEFELAYYNVAVQSISHNVTRTYFPTRIQKWSKVPIHYVGSYKYKISKKEIKKKKRKERDTHTLAWL